MSEETEMAEEVVQEMQEVAQEVQEESSHEETAEPKHVPLVALQKERKKRQELEYELQLERQRLQELQKPQDDSYRYESATKEDLMAAQHEAVRLVEEKLWIKTNPEKYELINTQLPEFLKQRPNLAAAINAASNRYEEAYTLMNALNPKPAAPQKKEQARQNAPLSPNSVPKSAGINQTMDVMHMSDDEFLKWRKQQRSR